MVSAVRSGMDLGNAKLAGNRQGQLTALTNLASAMAGGNPYQQTNRTATRGQLPTAGQMVSAARSGMDLGNAKLAGNRLGQLTALTNLASTMAGGDPYQQTNTRASGAGSLSLGSDVGGYVTLTSMEMSAYTDGKAYDVLTILPDDKTYGQFVYEYGIPLENARSLLATGYALAADTSAWGGNPRKMISWRSYPVSVGSRIKMAIEWKKWQMVNTPLANRYENRRP